MEAAPRCDLNEDEILELEAYLSRRRARERRPATKKDGDGKLVDLTHTAPATTDSPDFTSQRFLGKDGLRRILILTPESADQIPNQSMPLFIHHPFETQTPPLLIRCRQQGQGLGEGKHLEMTIGPDLDSWRAELYKAWPDEAGKGDTGVDQGLVPNRVPARRGRVAALTCNPAVALGLATVVSLFWVL